MKFGLFDHVDRSTGPLAEQFDERLEFVAAADEAGFYCYHVAEHHGTPLNMVPVPGVYLGAVARATRRLRLGPLVYLLPLYSPLRLIEEICMLDHLSRGRLDVGVGRGVSPYELNFHNVDPETSREVFLEALDVIVDGLSHERLDHAGRHYSYSQVPMVLRPMQRPHPPLWYGSTNEESSAWAGGRGFNFVTLGAMEPARRCIDAYKAAYAERGAPAVDRGDFPGGTAIGVLRHVVIAESAEEAERIARPAYDHWYASLTKLERDAVSGPRVARSMFASVDEAVSNGLVLLGTAMSVRAELERQIEELGVNYLVLGLYFGTLSLAHARRTLEAFASEIMPALSDR